MKRIRVLVADDHDVVRRGICTMVEKQSGWEIVGEAANGREAVEMAKRLRPDVVILDVGMPKLNGLDATRQILGALPQTEILIVTMHQTEQMVHDVLEAGARGYISKTDTLRHLVRAVDALSQHKPYFTSDVAGVVLDGFLKWNSVSSLRPQPRLTPREREILQLLAEGMRNKEIAADLGITFRTVETHRINIMRKLGAHSVTELVRYAVQNKIVQL